MQPIVSEQSNVKGVILFEISRLIMIGRVEHLLTATKSSQFLTYYGRAIPSEKLVGRVSGAHFKKCSGGCLRVVSKSLRGGLMGHFLQCVNGKISL